MWVSICKVVYIYTEGKISYHKQRICLIGLGYVGLQLARFFSLKYCTIVFYLNQTMVVELMNGRDSMLEVPKDILKNALQTGIHHAIKGLVCTINITLVIEIVSAYYN